MKNPLRKVINRSSINPYTNLARSALESWNKFRWDLTGDALISRNNLNRIYRLHSREKAVILCNGPSLLEVDFDLLTNANVFSIGLNKINLLFDKTEFRPNAIVAINPYVIEQNRDYYMVTEIPLYLEQGSARRFALHATNSCTLLFTSDGYPGFSGDIRYSISRGSTVTYVAMQLAYFMGFTHIALVGCDHSFATEGPDHKLVTAADQDSDHFDPRYFSGGVPWQLPSISESEESYMRAKRFFGYDNRFIYNCTVGGKLELLPRMSLEDFLSI